MTLRFYNQIIITQLGVTTQTEHHNYSDGVSTQTDYHNYSDGVTTQTEHHNYSDGVTTQTEYHNYPHPLVRLIICRELPDYLVSCTSATSHS